MTGTHGPIEDEHRQRMNELAALLDIYFNSPDGETKPTPEQRTVGFALLIFNFGSMDGGRINYISNGDRKDVHVALKELLARWEGRDYAQGGKA